MLIEFSVSNFRSFGGTQTLSLAAGSYEELPENKIVRSLPGLKGLDFLSATAIYGANASGKSNLLIALNCLCNFVGVSFRSEIKQPTCAAPFKLSDCYQELPTIFDIAFVADNIRCQYHISLTSERVIEESLFAYPNGQSQKWFNRQWNNGSRKYDWSFGGAVKKGLPQIAEQTRPNVAFLSSAAHLNHSRLADIHKWFIQTVKTIDFASGFLPHSYTMSLMQKSQEYHSKVMSLLKNADFGITNGQINEKDIPDNELQQIFPPAVLTQILQEQQKNGNQGQFKLVSVSFSHKGSENDTTMDFNGEESAGTKRYFALLGLWLHALENGSVLVIDELETCLHPLLVVELIKLFRSPYNKNGAQLIFTTHNPLLLDETLLRRDQVWFAEKKQNGETNLYPLSDFSPRKGEALVKGYLAGRYGGVPLVSHGLGLNKNE